MLLRLLKLPCQEWCSSTAKTLHSGPAHVHRQWKVDRGCICTGLVTHSQDIPLALQLGVERGGRSGDREGWAWVSGQGGQGDRVMEAYRLADFVRNTLRLEVRGSLLCTVLRVQDPVCMREHTLIS